MTDSPNTPTPSDGEGRAAQVNAASAARSEALDSTVSPVAGPEPSGWDSFQRLRRAVADSADLVAFLDFLTKTAVEVLSTPESEVFCGVTLLRPKRAATVASSSDKALQMDEVQYTFDDGPCLTAAREERTVQIRDVEDLDRNSKYRDAMESYGVRTVLATPILLPGDSFSALNLYSTVPDAFSEDRHFIAERFAQEAAKSLRLAVRIAELVDEGANVRAAMKSRHIIDMAIGIIMSQNKCTQEQAFSIMRQASSARNIKLRDLASNIVSSLDGTPSSS